VGLRTGALVGFFEVGRLVGFLVVGTFVGASDAPGGRNPPVDFKSRGEVDGVCVGKGGGRNPPVDVGSVGEVDGDSVATTGELVG
jgi:hypothetical protein